MAGGNNEGIFALVNFGWNDEPDDSPIRWHTEDPETDPWEWRMRVLEDRSDIAYGKVFFRKGGFITKEWYPFFLAARSQNRHFEEDYFEGLISYEAKRIYQVVSEVKEMSLDDIKRAAGFSREDKSKFDRGLVELQMRMYLTICGRQQRISSGGVGRGWNSTVFCTTERFFGDQVFEKARKISKEDAAEAIRQQILGLNPEASSKKIKRFIEG